MKTINNIILKGSTVILLTLGLSSLGLAKGNENSDLITVNWVDTNSGQSVSVTLPQHMPLSALKVKMLGTSQVSASEKNDYYVTTCDSNRRGGWGRRANRCTNSARLNESLNMLALDIEDGDTLYLYQETTTTNAGGNGNSDTTNAAVEAKEGVGNGKGKGMEKGKRTRKNKNA